MALATTWMDLKGILLGEISQAETDKYQMVSLTCGILKKQIRKLLIGTENRLVVARGGMGKMGELGFLMKIFF